MGSKSLAANALSTRVILESRGLEQYGPITEIILQSTLNLAPQNILPSKT